MTQIFLCDIASNNAKIGLWLWHDNALIKHHYITTYHPHRHSSLMFEWLDIIQEKTASNYRDSDIILCARGPGSYTAIRVGLATMIGLAQPNSPTNDNPLQAFDNISATIISYLAAHAHLLTQSSYYRVILDSRRATFFYQDVYYNAELRQLEYGLLRHDGGLNHITDSPYITLIQPDILANHKAIEQALSTCPHAIMHDIDYAAIMANDSTCNLLCTIQQPLEPLYGMDALIN